MSSTSLRVVGVLLRNLIYGVLRVEKERSVCSSLPHLSWYSFSPLYQVFTTTSRLKTQLTLYMQKIDPAFLQMTKLIRSIYRMCDSVSNSVAWELVGTPVVGGAWETLVVGAWSMGMEFGGVFYIWFGVKGFTCQGFLEVPVFSKQSSEAVCR